MRTTIDAAGRLVVPKALRDSLGLAAGEVEITADGNGFRVEALAANNLEEEQGRLVIGPSGGKLDDAGVFALRDADRG